MASSALSTENSVTLRSKPMRLLDWVMVLQKDGRQANRQLRRALVLIENLLYSTALNAPCETGAGRFSSSRSI
jgi:hypothetical protein